MRKAMKDDFDVFLRMSPSDKQEDENVEKELSLSRKSLKILELENDKSQLNNSDENFNVKNNGSATTPSDAQNINSKVELNEEKNERLKVPEMIKKFQPTISQPELFVQKVAKKNGILDGKNDTRVEIMQSLEDKWQVNEEAGKILKKREKSQKRIIKMTLKHSGQTRHKKKMYKKNSHQKSKGISKSLDTEQIMSKINPVIVHCR